MQKFCFKLNKTEERFRDNIDSAMMYDRPETFLFFKNYGKGLSFTKNGDIITGVYLQNSDKEADGITRGSSIKVRFYGKIITTDEGTFFSGWIYPDPIGLLVVLSTFFAFLIENNGIWQIILPTVATVLFFVFDITLTGKCFNELSFITSGE